MLTRRVGRSADHVTPILRRIPFSLKARLIAIIAILCVGLPGTALAIPANWMPDPDFPDFYQQDPAVNDGGCACAAVAATDSLFWLAETYNMPGLATFGGATWQDVTNTIQGPDYMNRSNGRGTYSASFASGLQAYIDAAGDGNKLRVETQLGGQGDPPTLAWIEQQVAAGQDVEILIGAVTDNPDGGHYVAVTGYTSDGFLRIADPWTDNNDNGEFLTVTGTGDTTLDFNASGNEVPDYTQSYVRVNLSDGLFEGSQYQMIFAAVAESPVPEPGTVFIFVGGTMAGLWFLARRRIAKAES